MIIKDFIFGSNKRGILKKSWQTKSKKENLIMKNCVKIWRVF